MSDIDFDELDRAVNSLMQPKQASRATQQPSEPAANSTERDDESVVTTAPPLEPPSKPSPLKNELSPVNETPKSFSQPSVAATPSPDPEEKNASDDRPKVEVKKRGQFMDIVRTSSGVKPAVSPAPKLAPRRLSTLLQPSANDAAGLTTEPVKPVEPVAEVETIQEVIEQPAAEESWPDPIDTEETKPTDDLPDRVDETEPLSSPFLADAKVDKRPLGGLQPTTELTAEPVADPEVTAPESSDTDDTSILPEELGQDILAVEAAASIAPAKPADPVTVRPVSSPSTVPAAAPTASSIGSLPQGPPPQPASSSDSEPDSSIFDTEHYQPPIKHPVKRKSSWPIVLAIVLLVLLGTGGGIAFYLLSSGY